MGLLPSLFKAMPGGGMRKKRKNLRAGNVLNLVDKVAHNWATTKKKFTQKKEFTWWKCNKFDG